MINPRIILCCDNDNVTEQLMDQFNSQHIIINEVIGSNAIVNRIEQVGPVVLFIAESPGNQAIMNFVDKIKERNFSIAIVLLLQEFSLEKVKIALRAGVIDVLQIPEEMDSLEIVFNRAWQSLKSKEETSLSEKNGQLIAIYSAKGGTGKTLVAFHLAHSIKLHKKNKVLLIDLNLQFGGIHNYLEAEAQRSLIDLIPVIDELNINHFNKVVVQVDPPGLEVLLGPAKVETADLINDRHINELLSIARKFYDFVVMDLPSELNISSLSALSISDQIFYIVTPDSPSLIAMKSAYSIFARLGLKESKKISLIINRVSNKNEININDIAMLSEYPPIAQIRSDFSAIQSSVNLGKPLFTCLGEKGLTKLARDLLVLGTKV